MINRNGAAASVLALCVGALFLACFWPVLFQGRQFAFRDSSDFYYPLYERVQQEWRAGRLPLWSPEENGGMPLLGNPTAAVLYPGKLVYAALPYPWAARVYIIVHVLLAFANLRALLRHWGASQAGSSLGALAYAFGAPVLTQYCNVVFLVGAAWMPLGFLAADCWIRLGKKSWLSAFAVVLAMQTLGGDPEAAYLTAVAALGYAAGVAFLTDAIRRRRRVVYVLIALAAIYVILLWLEIRTAARLASADRSTAEVGAEGWLSPTFWVIGAWAVAGLGLLFRWIGRRGESNVEGRLLGLGCACALALALIGIELLPALELTSQSTRAEGGRLMDVYANGLHPARLIEGAWPNVFGKPFGINRSWLSILPPTYDHRIWLTSLYMGGMTALLVLGAAGFRHGPVRGWLTAVLLVSLLASFGAFGSPVFWLRTHHKLSAFVGPMDYPEWRNARWNGWIRDGDGGAYWLLASLLPGFRSFRFPAKLLIPAALAASALAGLGWDELALGRTRRYQLAAGYALALSLLGFFDCILASRNLLKYWSDQVAMATTAYGPLDPARALVDARFAFLQGSILAGVLLVLCRFAPRRPVLAGAIVLAITTVDLAMANPAHVGTVPQSVFEQEPRILAAIRNAERARGEDGSEFRVYRLPNWSPMAWNLRGSPARLEEIVRWERDTLRPKYAVPYGVDAAFSFGTSELLDHSLFFQPRGVLLNSAGAAEFGAATGQRAIYFPRRGFDLWNTRYFILPTRLSLGSRFRGFASMLADTDPIYPESARFSGPTGEQRLSEWARDQDVQVLRNRAAYPRAWVVHRARVIPPITGSSVSERSRVMDELLYQDDVLWHDPARQVFDLRDLAFVEVEGEQARAVRSHLSRTRPDASEAPKFVAHGSDRVVVDVTLRSPGLLVLADVYYPGWSVAIDGEPQEILRVNRAMRGALVPSGKHRVVFRYRPASVAWGACLSGAGLLLLAVFTAVSIRADRNNRSAE
jgi:Bacterial membrane protein YfhO